MNGARYEQAVSSWSTKVDFMASKGCTAINEACGCMPQEVIVTQGFSTGKRDNQEFDRTWSRPCRIGVGMLDSFTRTTSFRASWVPRMPVLNTSRCALWGFVPSLSHTPLLYHEDCKLDVPLEKCGSCWAADVTVYAKVNLEPSFCRVIGLSGICNIIAHHAVWTLGIGKAVCNPLVVLDFTRGYSRQPKNPWLLDAWNCCLDECEVDHNNRTFVELVTMLLVSKPSNILGICCRRRSQPPNRSVTTVRRQSAGRSWCEEQASYRAAKRTLFVFLDVKSSQTWMCSVYLKTNHP